MHVRGGWFLAIDYPLHILMGRFVISQNMENEAVVLEKGFFLMKYLPLE